MVIESHSVLRSKVPLLSRSFGVEFSSYVYEFDLTGSTLIVDCNITDSRDNTNPRCWRVNNTLVDNYYSESKRVQEGIEWVFFFSSASFL